MKEDQNFFEKIWQPGVVKQIGFVLTLCLIIVICYYPASKNSFLHWDDEVYVRNNHDIQNMQFENIKLFFSKSYMNVYVPLTMVSYALDYMIGGLNPRVYIYTNILFHLLNAILVFWLIFAILNTLKDSDIDKKNNFMIAVITSVFFIIHPIQVESVVWISERKNILYCFFYLMSLLCYVKYVKSDKKILFVLSLLLFILSLLSKGSAVSLPLCIIAIDFLFGFKLFSKKVILKIIPYLILSLIAGIIAIKSQHNTGQTFERSYPEQIACAAYSFMSYIQKLVIPFNLYALYNFPQKVSFIYWMALILSLVFLALILFFRKKISRIILFGILFFLANIIFMLQIIPDWDTMMADRYMYLPSIGFFLIATILIIKISARSRIILLILPVAIVLYGFTTYKQVKVWENDYTLWDNVIKKDKLVSTAWNNMGLMKRDSGNFEEAYVDFSKAIRLKPDFKEPYNNRGIINAQFGRPQEAMSDFNKAVEIDPTFAMALYNRGKLKKINKDYASALVDLDHSIKHNPNYINAYILRARLYCRLDSFNNALNDCDFIQMLDKRNIVASVLRAGILYRTGQFWEAIFEVDNLIEIDASKGILYYIRSISNLKLGNNAQSVKDFDKAKSLGYIPEKDGLAADLGIQ